MDLEQLNKLVPKYTYHTSKVKNYKWKQKITARYTRSKGECNKILCKYLLTVSS